MNLLLLAKDHMKKAIEEELIAYVKENKSNLELPHNDIIKAKLVEQDNIPFFINGKESELYFSFNIAEDENSFEHSSLLVLKVNKITKNIIGVFEEATKEFPAYNFLEDSHEEIKQEIKEYEENEETILTTPSYELIEEIVKNKYPYIEIPFWDEKSNEASNLYLIFELNKNIFSSIYVNFN